MITQKAHEMTIEPVISDDLFSRVLADPEAMEVLEVLAVREGISTPFPEIPREKQIEARYENGLCPGGARYCCQGW